MLRLRVTTFDEFIPTVSSSTDTESSVPVAERERKTVCHWSSFTPATAVRTKPGIRNTTFPYCNYMYIRTKSHASKLIRETRTRQSTGEHK